MTFGFRLASNGMPVNNCSDSAPMWTLRKYGDVQVEPGCLSLMGDGNRLGIFMLFCQAGVWGRVLPWTAVRLMSLNAVIYVVICLAIGFNKQTFVMQQLMFAVASGACALQCHLLDRQTKHAFALHKINGFVHQSSYRILRTLIPPNVLAEFSKRCVDPGHREGGDDGAGAGGRREEEVEQELNMRRHQPLREAVAIKHCTIMVCSLRFSVANVHDFELVSQLFRAYDEAVWESGMFKYQHVAQGPIHYYIVGCPRIACPYDLEQHRAVLSLPRSHADTCTRKHLHTHTARTIPTSTRHPRMCVCVCVCLCVCARERARASVCASVCASVRASVHASVREQEKEAGRDGGREGGRKRVCDCVIV